MPAHTIAIAPGVMEGIAFTVILMGIALLVPQLFVTVIVPVYTPAGVDAETGISSGLEGKDVPAVTLVRPAGDPAQPNA